MTKPMTKPMKQIDLSSHFALLRFSGEDATGFLQGQVSNDLEQLDGVWHFSAYCNPKGRTIALLLVWRVENEYFSLISADVAESTLKRLRMYVLRSKVNIDLLAEAEIVGHMAENTPLPIDDSSGDIDPLARKVEIANESAVLSYFNRKIEVVPSGRKSGAKQAINANQSELQDSLEDWISADIESGLPIIDANNTELFIPQMINLDLLGGISFKKGCYTGQEIVARMHYLGKLKQRMLLCSVDQTNSESRSAKSGDKLYQDEALSKVVGTVVSCTSKGRLLAVLRLDAIEQACYLESGHRVEVAASQPYAIPDTHFS